MKRFAVIFAAAALVAACDANPEAKPSTTTTGGTAASSAAALGGASAPSAALSNAMAKPIQPGSTPASGHTVLDMSAMPSPSGAMAGDATAAPDSHLNNSYDTGTDDSAAVSGSSGETFTDGDSGAGTDEGQGH